MTWKPGEPFKHGKRTCIFCGGASDAKISAEHIWPQWAASFLPFSDMHGILEAKIDSADRTIRHHKNYRRQGPVNSVCVRTVCKGCNSGWMGTYEEDVRPFLEPMMKGGRAHLDEREHRLLVEYLTYKILTIDAGHVDSFAPPEWAVQFHNDRTIPDGITIYALTCFEGDWQLKSSCYGAQIGPELSDPKGPPNIKSFSIGFGFLFVFAVLRKEGELDFTFEPGAAIKLWPFLGSEVRWPTLKPIKSGQAEFVARSLYRSGKGPDLFDLTEIV